MKRVNITIDAQTEIALKHWAKTYGSNASEIVRALVTLADETELLSMLGAHTKIRLEERFKMPAENVTIKQMLRTAEQFNYRAKPTI